MYLPCLTFVAFAAYSLAAVTQLPVHPTCKGDQNVVEQICAFFEPGTSPVLITRDWCSKWCYKASGDVDNNSLHCSSVTWQTLNGVETKILYAPECPSDKVDMICRDACSG